MKEEHPVKVALVWEENHFAGGKVDFPDDK